MNCDTARNLLPLFVYDDLEPDEALAVARHLADCRECQTQHAALAQARTALDAMPTPKIALDPENLWRSESLRQSLRIRRWRRATITLAAVAAGLLFVVALRIEVRVGNGQLTLAWGAPTQRIVDPMPTARKSESDVQERLQLVQEIARALATDVADRDGRQQAAITRLRAEIEGVQRLSAERWRETERDVAVLYRTAFHRPEPGEKQ
jgi:hypothetical protein